MFDVVFFPLLLSEFVFLDIPQLILLVHFEGESAKEKAKLN